MKCQHKDCTAEAVTALAINVPAIGFPIAEHDPIRIVLGLTLCDEHFATVKAADFIGQEASAALKQIVNLAAKGKAPPDYARAWISRVPFDSPAWLALSKATHGTPPNRNTGFVE